MKLDMSPTRVPHQRLHLAPTPAPAGTHHNGETDLAAPPPIQVAVVDPGLRAVVEALRPSLGGDVRLHDTGRALLDAPTDRTFGCLVLEPVLPDMSAMTLLSELGRRHGRTPTAVLTATRIDIGAAVAAVRSGHVVDILTAPVQGARLLAAIRDAVAEDRLKFDRFEARRRFRERLDLLSPRERQVLDALAAGRSNKSIAGELGLSHKTIATHRANVILKFGAQTILDVVCPLRAGL